jgi:hypothetical protein
MGKTGFGADECESKRDGSFLCTGIYGHSFSDQAKRQSTHIVVCEISKQVQLPTYLTCSVLPMCIISTCAKVLERIQPIP